MANKYTHRGTKITGTSTKAKVFEKAKFKKESKKGDTYLNTKTGHVYQCAKGGGNKKAKWKYIRTDIIGIPKEGVSDLGTPTRSGHTMSASWKNPKNLTTKTSGSRAEKHAIVWTLDTTDKNDIKVSTEIGASNTSTSINLNSFKYGSATLNRKSFYPVHKTRKLFGVTVSVNPKNEKGKSKKGKTSGKRTFAAPQVPTIGDFSFNVNTGVVSTTITSTNDAYKDRYDTYYELSVYDSRSKITTTTKGSSSNTSFTVYRDIPDYQSLPYTGYVKVTVKAYARGFVGNSKAVSKPYYVSYPNEPVIGVPSVDTSEYGTGKCTVTVDTKVTTEHPCDQVRFEYLTNVTYSDANQIPGDASWESSDIVDNGNCSAMTIPISFLVPDRGKYTWIRVKSYHANENVLCRYSKPQRVKELENKAATAEDDKIVVLSARQGSDGKSIVVQLGWNQDGTDDSTGTELSWSQEEDAWKSTKAPDSYNFTWSDGEKPSGNVTYQDSAEITIKDLEEGELYHIKARRYLEGDDGTSYSPYSNKETCMTSEPPEAVVASCSRFVPVGQSLPVYWTFSGNGIQTEWQIVKVNVTYELTTDTEVIGTQTYYRYDSTTQTYVIVRPESGESGASGESGSGGTGVNPSAEGWYVAVIGDTGVIIDSGKGSIGATQISAEKLSAHATNSNLTFVVRVSTGSEFVTSDAYIVSIIDIPTLSITVSSPLKVQPLSFTAQSSRMCDLIVIVTSQGASSQRPEGMRHQLPNDTIHNGIYSPAWTESEGTYTATVNIPSELDFWDLCKYNLSVVAIDRETGLRSTEAVSEFAIAWEHQAASVLPTEVYNATSDTEVDDDKTYYAYNDATATYVPVEDTEGVENPSEAGWYEVTVTDYVTLTPNDATDDSGHHRKTVTISLTPPPNSNSDDLYDIYRLTGDGATLIGWGFPLTHETVDEYAPFGDDLTMHYRFAIRTVDGDVEYGDIEYVADGDYVRFDWAGGYLELPYNISIGDKYKKDSQIRYHKDGSVDGYWNGNIERTASYSSDLIRLEQQEDINKARQLARYSGPVFVRTPDGIAFEADVQVTDLSTDGTMSTIAIDATEIGLTQEFSLPVPRVLESGESGSSGESGASGASGESGQSGESGASGSSGTSGE